jgi:hypothetical protein
MPVPTHERIADHLFQVAEARTWLHGLSFDSEVSSSMKGMAGQGAATILRAAQHKPEQAKERYVLAAARVGSEAMVVFVDRMAMIRLVTPPYVEKHETQLHSDIWTRVRDLLCPFWPICD